MTALALQLSGLIGSKIFHRCLVKTRERWGVSETLLAPGTNTQSFACGAIELGDVLHAEAKVPERLPGRWNMKGYLVKNIAARRRPVLLTARARSHYGCAIAR